MPPPDAADDRRASLRDGAREARPYAAVGFVIAFTFGALATEAGLGAVPAVAMSAVVFAGAGQFAAISIVAAGGGIGAAVVAATLVSSRYLPMAIALAPSLRGRPWSRALQGQAVIDTSWALSARGDGRFDPWCLFGASALQYATWVGGTVAGVVAGGALGDAESLGLDAALPVFFVSLLAAELRDRRAVPAAALGAAIALALLPLVPPGIPVLVAGTAALLGLRARAA